VVHMSVGFAALTGTVLYLVLVCW